MGGVANGRSSVAPPFVCNERVYSWPIFRAPAAYGGYELAIHVTGCNGDIPVPRTGGTAVPARLSRTSSICSGSAHRMHERNPNRTDRHDTRAMLMGLGSVGTGVVCGHQCDHSGQWHPDAPDGLQHARIQPPQSTSQSAPRLGLLSSSGWTWPCASRALWSTQHDLPIPGNRP